MFKSALFQAHWLLGITAGVVLLIVGVSGGLLSFDDEIVARLNPQVVGVEPDTYENTHERLSVAALIAAVSASQPTKRVSNITVYSDLHKAPRVTLIARANDEASAQGVRSQRTAQSQSPPRRRGEVRYVDPYNGELLGDGKLKGQEFFRTVEQIHRGMIAGPTGRMVVGISTIALIVMALSGLYLRWPRSGTLKWRTWFKLDTQLSGRAFLWHLHSLIGTWVCVFYLIAALTGLNLSSFEWYRKGIVDLVGATPASREPLRLSAPAQGIANIDRIWLAFEKDSGAYSMATLTLPQNPMQAVEVRYLSADAPHERAYNQLMLHPDTGEILRRDLYAAKTSANRFIASLFPLHSGSFFGVGGIVLVMLASFAMPLFAVTGWMLYLDRRRRKRLANAYVETAAFSEPA